MSSCFNSIPHEKLMRVLAGQIKCTKTLALIRSLISVGVKIKGIHVHSKVGIPQGRTLRPLLCNIFLHRLDVHIEEFCKEQTVGGKRPVAKAYSLAIQRSRAAYKKGNIKLSTLLRKEAQSIHSKDIMSPKANRVFYVRYADDIFIGVVGPIRLARKALGTLQSYLESLGLSSKERKTNIVHRRKGVIFLGAKISRFSGNLASPFTNKKINDSTFRTRVHPELGIGIRILYLLKKLEAKKIVKFDHKYGRFKSTALRGLINKDHVEIVGYFNRL